MTSRVFYLAAGMGILLVVAIGTLVQSYLHSHAYSSAQRLTVGVWGRGRVYVLSLSKDGRQHLLLQLANDKAVSVPGGLKGYKVGALGKLAKLEHDTTLVKKSLSLAAQYPLDGILYEDTEEIYYGSAEELDHTQVVDEVKKRVFDRGDLGIFDRWYIWYLAGSIRKSNTRITSARDTLDTLLFDKQFRAEKRLVQIQTETVPQVGVILSQILESIGIRVADVSPATSKQEGCTVVEKSSPYSSTARYLATYFGCTLDEGVTGLYETVFRTGPLVEKQWKP